LAISFRYGLATLLQRLGISVRAVGRNRAECKSVAGPVWLMPELHPGRCPQLLHRASQSRASTNRQGVFSDAGRDTVQLLSGTVGCKGDNLPGVQAKDKHPYTDIGTDSGIQPSTSTSYNNGLIKGHKIKTLPAFHSITADAVICGVDDAHTTAFKDAQGRGFVMSPRGSDGCRTCDSHAGIRSWRYRRATAPTECSSLQGLRCPIRAARSC